MEKSSHRVFVLRRLLPKPRRGGMSQDSPLAWQDIRWEWAYFWWSSCSGRVRTFLPVYVFRKSLPIDLSTTRSDTLTRHVSIPQTILADDTYSKPFFVTYINTSFFITFLVIVIARRLFRLWRHGKLAQVRSWRTLLLYLDSHGMKDSLLFAREIPEEDDYGGGHGENSMQRQRLLYNDAGESPDVPPVVADQSGITPGGRLGLRATARLSVQFCMLWFLANYFAIACLQYTNVGSTTILTSTSGVWTLIFGAVIGVEKFTVRKFFGVIASLIGVILISRVDMSSPDESTTPNSAGGDNGQGSFPHKTTAEIALGDAMAAFSAIVYGIYTIVMKKQVGDESRVNMQLFFGLVGFFNVFFLWPGFIILHLLGIEEFGLPPTRRVWTIILVRSLPRPPFILVPPYPSQLKSLLTRAESDQLHFVPGIRHMLGLRDAADHPTRRHGRFEPNHPALARGADHPARPIRERAVLDRRRHRLPIVFDRQPREQRTKREPCPFSDKSS